MTRARGWLLHQNVRTFSTGYERDLKSSRRNKPISNIDVGCQFSTESVIFQHGVTSLAVGSDTSASCVGSGRCRRCVGTKRPSVELALFGQLTRKLLFKRLKQNQKTVASRKRKYICDMTFLMNDLTLGTKKLKKKTHTWTKVW